MDNKLLIASIGLVIIALVSVPVMAASSPVANPLDQILTILRDIQNNVNTLVANLPEEPTGYEYYTGVLRAFGGGITHTDTWVINYGSSEAQVCVINQVFWPSQIQTDCDIVPPGENMKSTFVNLGFDQVVKITTDSQYAVPYLERTDGPGTLLEKYSPNDFMKLEIYT